MGCCLSTDEKIGSVLLKFPVTSFATLQPSQTPQLIVGRIMAIGNPLISPVKECKCVYYHVNVSEKLNDHWEHRFRERMWQDFILYDPQYPQTRILVQTQNVNMIVRGINDGHKSSGRGAVSFFESEAIPPGITKLLERHNFRVETDIWIGKLKKEMNYVEESFDVGEQIACLGIVRDGVDPMGLPIKVLYPAHDNCLDEFYFNNHDWTRPERSLWSELLGPGPCVIASDDPAVFKDVNIKPIPPDHTASRFASIALQQIQQNQQQQGYSMMNLVPYAQSTQSNQSLPQYPQHRPSVQYQPVQAVVTQTLVPQPFFNPTIVYPSPPMQQVPVGYPIQQFDQQVRRPSQVYPVQLQQIQSAAPPQYQTTAHPKTHPTTRSFFR